MLKIYDVFEPTTPDKPSVCGINSHGSSITELPDGKIMCVWYAGSYEKAPDVGIFYSIFDPKTESWSDVKLLEKEAPNKSEGNPVIFYDKDTSWLWLFWATMDRAGYKHIPGGWSTCKIKIKHSADLGKTWTEPRYLTKLWGRMTRNKPIRMSNGDVLLPMYSEWMGYKGNMYIATKEEFAKGALKSKWFKIGPIKGGVMQPTVVELEQGHLIAYLRTSTGGRFKGWTSITESYDYGRTWSPIRKGTLPNPNSGCDMVKLKDGSIVLAFNNSPTNRCPLSIALSEDETKTWSYINDLETDASDGARYGYPAIIQASDGTIYCSYTNKHGINIRMARFDIEWIKEGKKLS